MANRGKKAVIGGAVIILVLVIIQWAGPEIDKPPVTGKIKTPPEVGAILDKACADCHSNEPRLKWYDKIAPASWLVASDIKKARLRFNLSTWNNLTEAEQEGELWEMVNMAISKRMPLRAYILLHPAAKLSPQDIAVLKNYIDTLSAGQPGRAAATVAADGVTLPPGYQKWQIISTTNRFDNLSSIRVVYGNGIAVQALRDNHINPWPDGATIVKMVWDIAVDKDGDIRPASFNNVQMMTKDSRRFPETQGWGFAKFDGLKLIPFGQTASFNTTCYNCHRLAEDYGYVFNVPPPTRSGQRELFQADGFDLITPFANRKQQTMSILYGNHPAVETSLTDHDLHTPGEIFTLVTWKQTDNKYWYGSFINGPLLGVETVKIIRGPNGSLDTTYQLHDRTAPKYSIFEDRHARIDMILAQRPSVLPNP